MASAATPPVTSQQLTSKFDLVLPGLGDLRPGNSVYLADGDCDRTLGFLFADDAVGNPCLLTLELDRRGDQAWQATVDCAIRCDPSGCWSHAPAARGATFRIADRETVGFGAQLWR
jgi:hypothetical protein